MEYAIILLMEMALIGCGYLSARYIAKYLKRKTRKSKPIKKLKDLYCFECEIEMPANEKDGRLYCTNCKLFH